MTTPPAEVPREQTAVEAAASESADAARAANEATVESDRATAESGADGAPPALAVRNLSKTFGSGDAAVTAVDGVSFTVEPGTVVGLLGPNGAGKTTTIKSTLGLVVPTSGTVEIGGIDVHEHTRAAYSRVGAMLEGARNVYWKLTPRENLEFFAAVGGEDPAALRERHDQLLDQLSLTEKAHEPVNDLSQGQKQKVSLACALARDVDVAFLDEPTLGLDVESGVELRREIRRLAEQEGVTIVLSSHDMDVVEDVCDRVVVMNDGQIIADDAVSNLVDVFRSHAYRVELDGELPDDARQHLRERYDAGGFERYGTPAGGADGNGSDGRERFEATLSDPDRFYDLVDDLRATDLSVLGVESVDADLESAFLALTNGEGAAPSAANRESPSTIDEESPADGTTHADDGARPADAGVTGSE